MAQGPPCRRPPDAVAPPTRSSRSRVEERERFDLAQALQGLQRMRSSKQVFALLADAVGTDLPRQAIEALVALGTEIMPVAEVAKRARMDVGAVSRQLRMLEESGYVSKSPSAQNRSVVLVEATSRGRRLSGLVKRVQDRHLNRALEKWSREDRRRLATLLDRLVTNLQETPYEREGRD